MKQGRFPCGRMSSVQSGLEPLGYPHCLQWYLQVPALILGYSTILDALISGFLWWLITGFPWWLSLLDFLALISGSMDNSQETGFQ